MLAGNDSATAPLAPAEPGHLPLYPVELEIFISKVGAVRTVLAAGSISDQARRLLAAFLTRLGTGEGGWGLASFIASANPG